MCETLVVTGEGGTRELGFRSLRGWFGRLRGLLGTNSLALPVALVGCSSIHTFGMRYPLDVALVTRDGRVLAVWRGLPPGCVASARGSWVALERPARVGPWVSAGERVDLRFERARKRSVDGERCHG